MTRMKLRQKCEFCGRAFLFKKQLLIHQERVHDKDLPYACAKCKRAFSSAWDLNDHIMNHFLVSNTKLLERPLTKIINVVERPTDKRILKIVLSRLCNDTVTDGGNESNDPVRRDCNDIGRTGSISGLRSGYHSGPVGFFKRRLEKDKRKVCRSVNNANNGEYAFPCTYCEKTFLRPRALKRHVLITHIKRKVYACTKCDQVFNKRADEVFHLMTHFNESSHSAEMTTNKDQSLIEHAIVQLSEPQLNDNSLNLTASKLLTLTASVPRTPAVLVSSDSMVLTTSALELHDSNDTNNSVTRVHTPSEVSYNSTVSYTPSLDDTVSEPEMKYTSDLVGEQSDIKPDISSETNKEIVGLKIPKKRGRKPGSKGSYKSTLIKFNKVESNESVEGSEPKKRGRKPGSEGTNNATWIKINQLESSDKIESNDKLEFNESIDKTEEPRKQERKSRSWGPYKSTAKKFYKSVATKLTTASKKSYYKKVKREVEQSKLIFGCTQCDKKFINPRQLKRHVFINHTEKRVYSCSQCDQVFSRSAFYSAHLAKVHCGGGVMSEDGSLNFSCPVCKKTYKKMYYLITHMRRSHTDATACLCTVCGRSFASSYNLRVHESIHNSVLPECVECGSQCLPSSTVNRYIRQAQSVEQSYTCQQCDKTFVLAFDRKFPTSDDAQMHICAQCGRKFTQRFLLKRHEITHSSEKPFPCKKCGKGFGSAWFLKTHITNKHNNDFDSTDERSYNCRQCAETFKRVWDLNQHLKCMHSNSLPHVCTHCGEGFVSEGRLKIHATEHTGKLKCICSVCGKTYSQPSALKIHVMRNHSGERPYKCDQCETTFSTAVDLRQHIKKVVHDRTYDCTQCKVKFEKYWDLNRHMKTSHRDALPHVCSHSNCTQRFSSKSLLKLHEAGHTGKLKCICTKCGESHLNPSALKMHMIRLHNGERPHVCTRCGMSFITAGNLKQHEVVHTGEKPYACEQCSRRFAQISTMHAHIQRAHAVNTHTTVNTHVMNGDTPVSNVISTHVVNDITPVNNIVNIHMPAGSAVNTHTFVNNAHAVSDPSFVNNVVKVHSPVLL